MIVSLLHDLRFALRQLRKTPAFTATAVLTLALGIGANAAIFTLVHAVMLRNLPVADPATLVRLGDRSDCCVGSGTPRNDDWSLFSTDTWQQIRKSTPEFAELAAFQAGYTYRPVTARRDAANDLARSVMGEFVSGNYFRTFGLAPAAGRLLTDADDVQGAPLVAVMSDDTWRHQYSGDPSIIGSTFFVNTRPVTIVGIAPQGYFGDRLSNTPPDFYLPIESMPILATAPYVHEPRTNWLYIVGRIKPGVAIAPLQAKLTTMLRQILTQNGVYQGESLQRLPRVHLALTPGGAGIEYMREQYGSHLRLLMWISGMVLVIACANIANLLVVRGLARKAEMSVRTALGARRSRIIRQLLTESILLAVIGGTAGLVVAYGGTRMLLALAFPGAQNLPIHANPSGPVLAFAFAVSLATGILFGVAPAWIAAHAQPADALRNGARTTVGGATLLQRALVVLQAASSLVLLIGAGLFSQSLRQLQHIDLKLDARNRYIVHINPQAAGYSQRQVVDLYRTIEQRFHALPGIQKVGISTYTPMEDNNDGWGVQLQGRPNRSINISAIKVSPEYFDSVGTRVLMGRSISPHDTAASTTVAVVNESFVRQLFNPGENPIGHHFGGGEESSGDNEIVGVVADTAYSDATWKNHAMYFMALPQRPASATGPIEDDELMYAGAVVLATDRPMPGIEPLVRRTLSSINPNLTVVKFQTFDQQIADRFDDARMLARLTTLFGALALLLAAIGLYGVTAYTVARRSSEIGIRMALGAERLAVTALVLRGVIAQTGLGLLIGIPAAILCVRFVESQLYEVKGIHPAVMALSVAILAVAAAIAGLVPARRAASIDPAQTLRIE